MSFVKYPFPLKGNSLPTTTKKLFYSIFFFFNSRFWRYQPGLNHLAFKERMPLGFYATDCHFSFSNWTKNITVNHKSGSREGDEAPAKHRRLHAA